MPKVRSGLTRKQKAFADALLEDKKKSATKAALEVYGKPTSPVDYNTARNIASENLAKPAILAYLQEHDHFAQARIVQLAAQDEEKTVALRASQDILDRTHGKAIQRQEIASKAVTISINLSQDND